MITRDEILKGQTCPPELDQNLSDLLNKINIIRNDYGQPLVVNSGYRSPEHNAKVGGAKNSAHLYCQAVDIRDYSRKFSTWCLQNIDKLEEVGLWLENPLKTPTWVHLQTRPTKNRVFDP